MAVTISGDTGISAVQAGAVQSGDLPAGSVIQVVNSSSNTQITSTLATYVASGISAIITPIKQNSKIVIISSISWRIFENSGDDARSYGHIRRNGSVLNDVESFLVTADDYGNSGILQLSQNSIHQVDESHNSTSALTYEFYFNHTRGTQTNINANGGESFITLMEIAG